jgi:hypothetical protein
MSITSINYKTPPDGRIRASVVLGPGCKSEGVESRIHASVGWMARSTECTVQVWRYAGEIGGKYVRCLAAQVFQPSCYAGEIHAADVVQ